MSSAASSRVEAGAGQPPAESTSEFQLLVACTSPSKTRVVNGPVNWERALQLAQHHGVVPQLSDAVEKSAVDVPPAMLESIRNENRNNTRQALWLTREMFRILEQLSARNVDALPYK